MTTRSKSDEAWVLDLCDAIIGEQSLRQHRFEWLRGDPSLRTGRRARLPVDAYWPNARIVVEYRERQHYEPVAHFDKPERLTATGVPRREQRARYDRIREALIPEQGLSLVVVNADGLEVNSRGRLYRNFASDIATLTDLLSDAVLRTAPRRAPRKELERREIQARAIVGNALAVVVKVNDSGERPRMVDAIFDYGGRKAALEVTRIVDDVREAQRAAVDGEETIAGLRSAWYVQLSERTSLKAIRQPLRRALMEVEARRIDGLNLERAEARSLTEPQRTLQRNGVRNIALWTGADAGQILYSMSPLVGAGTDFEGAIGWLTQTIRDPSRTDNVEKLRDHDGADERHLFLWADGRAAAWLQPVMESGVPQGAPGPDLPDGVTHVWLATTAGRWIAWFPDHGWWQK